jgi:hypothetical protein
MKVFYSPYSLTPLKRANRLSSSEQKHGVLIKGTLNGKLMFADYFPHLPLGDRSSEEFLEQFKFQVYEYDRKVFDLLLRDTLFQNLKQKKFMNHQLWDGIGPLDSEVIKYKLLHAQDISFMIPLEQGKRVRLDSNGLFTKSSYETFIKEIPEKYCSQLEYIEDPLAEKDWNHLKIPSAVDFIEGSPYEFYIYKPNCEFRPKTDAKIIFSAYLGHSFGNWQAYCEMVENADLSLTHGVVCTDFYQEEKSIFKGTYQNGFIPDQNIVRELYTDLSNHKWKLLCSM